MHRRICDHFRFVHARRVAELERRVRAKEDELRQREQDRQARLRQLDGRIRDLEQEGPWAVALARRRPRRRWPG